MTTAEDGFHAFVAGARGVVGVLRADEPDRALSLASAAVGAGLRCVDITWTTPGAASVVAATQVRDDLDAGALLVGAGSVFADSPEATRERVRSVMAELGADDRSGPCAAS